MVINGGSGLRTTRRRCCVCSTGNVREGTNNTAYNL